MFSIFNQSKNTFEGQLPDEKTLVVLREHWFNVSTRLGVVIILFILPFMGQFLLHDYLKTNGITSFYWLIAAIYLMFVWLRLFYIIFIYLLNIWVVTNHRVIDSEQHSFFSHRISELGIGDIQDVTVTIKGFNETMFRFGDIEVQTAAEEIRFKFKSIPEPEKVKDVIMRAHRDFLGSHHDNSAHEPSQSSEAM